MKKLLLVVLVLIGLQTQAQINWCDSISYGTLPQQTFTVIGYADLWNTTDSVTWDWTACNSQYCHNLSGETTTFSFINPTDTVKICYNSYIYLNGLISGCTSCDSLVWDSNMGEWVSIIHTQQAAPYFCCDSITYWTDQSQGFNIGLDTTGIVHNPDSIDVYWGVCTNGLCYADQGMYAYFPQVTTSDTLKVNYDVYLYENGVIVEVCSIEDWLVFNGTSWVLLNTIPTSINEITFNRINDNKMYDLMGREVTNVTLGTMYIKNGKKYIRTR